jgi:hypothetical protein
MKKTLPLWPALYILLVFVFAGGLVALVTGQLFSLISLSALGLFVALGFAAHALLPRAERHIGRRLSLFLVGGGLFVGVGIFGRQSFQIEGLWFYLLHGVVGGVVIHYLVAKAIGPLLMGRAWCGWGCWTWMLLDYLPFRRGTKATRTKGLGYLRLVHLGLSIALVLSLWALGYRHGTEWKTTDGVLWFLVGNALYYGSAVILAFVIAGQSRLLQDPLPGQRALAYERARFAAQGRHRSLALQRLRWLRPQLPDGDRHSALCEKSNPRARCRVYALSKMRFRLSNRRVSAQRRPRSKARQSR